MLIQQKPGSDRFTVELFDRWAMQSTSSGKRTLEIWLMEILRDGQFILNKPDNPSFRIRNEQMIHTDQGHDTAVQAFVERSTRKLFHILGNSERDGTIPQAVLQLGQLIHEELKTSRRLSAGFPMFVVTRWLFSSFIIDRIITPEVSLVYCVPPTY